MNSFLKGLTRYSFQPGIDAQQGGKKVVSLFLYPADHKMISRFTLQSMAQGSLFCLRTRNLLKTIGISVSDKSSLPELTAEIIRVESTEAHPGETDLYYERNVRWVRALREAEPAQNSGFSFKENGVYMITGGGFTLYLQNISQPKRKPILF